MRKWWNDKSFEKDINHSTIEATSGEHFFHRKSLKLSLWELFSILKDNIFLIHCLVVLLSIYKCFNPFLGDFGIPSAQMRPNLQNLPQNLAKLRRSPPFLPNLKKPNGMTTICRITRRTDEKKKGEQIVRKSGKNLLNYVLPPTSFRIFFYLLTLTSFFSVLVQVPSLMLKAFQKLLNSLTVKDEEDRLGLSAAPEQPRLLPFFRSFSLISTK